jgi:hypothetical protein
VVFFASGLRRTRFVVCCPHMRNPAQDLSPWTANSRANTNNPTQTPQPPLGGDGFEGPLPSTVLDELLRRRRVAKASSQRHFPPWFKSLLTLAGLVLAPALMLAAIAAAMWAFGWTPKAKHYTDPLLERTFHPMTQTPAMAGAPSPAVEVRRAEPMPAPRAQQVFRIGIWSPVWMPVGKLTWVRFLGVKDTFADLPRNPQIGDSYGVLEGGQRALWVWHTLPGHTTLAWVDP